jgi:site-specific recombinase XerD
MKSKKRRTLSENEIKRIIKAAKNEADKQIITMFYGTGIRASELSDLKLNDTNAKTGEIRTKGRAIKVRIVKYPQANLAALVDWLNDKRKDASANDFVFVSRSGEKLSLRRINKIVHQASERAGIRAVRPHDLRHAFVSRRLSGSPNFKNGGKKP